jgi:hypothetical protein
MEEPMSDYMLIKFNELPVAVRETARIHGFKGNQVKLTVCDKYVDRGSWCDYDCRTLVVVNTSTGEHKAITSGSYESNPNWSKEERAMYDGSMSVVMQPNIWILSIGTYPKRCEAYCHPTNVVARLSAPKPELAHREQVCLFVTRHITSAYRLAEARSYGFTTTEWRSCQANLVSLGLMTVNGGLTLAGKNAALDLHFDAWEEQAIKNAATKGGSR